MRSKDAQRAKTNDEGYSSFVDSATSGRGLMKRDLTLAPFPFLINLGIDEELFRATQ
jgi:hypothetical protein